MSTLILRYRVDTTLARILQELTPAIKGIRLVNIHRTACRIPIPGTRCNLRYGKELYLPAVSPVTAVLTSPVVAFSQYIMTTIVFVLVSFLMLMLMLVPLPVICLNGETGQHG